MPLSLDKHMFRAYDIRGVAYEQVHPEAAYAIAFEFGELVKEKYDKPNPRVVVGRDCRTHGPDLMHAVIHGLLAADCHIEIIGETPSPLNYFMICSTQADAGIQVSASHNPKEDNGLKLNLQNANRFYGENIQMLYGMITKRDVELPNRETLITMPASSSIKTVDATTPYANRMLEMFGHIPSDLKIVIDGGNGVAGPVYPSVLRKLGFEVVELYTQPDGTFPNHQADPSKHETLKELQALVVEQQADIGCAFDGDADRLGLVDEHGAICTSDETLIFLAKDLLSRHPNANIVYTVSNSSRLPMMIEQWGGNAMMAAVGTANVMTAMRSNDALLGGEISGHMFVAEDYYVYDDPLVALLRVVNLMATEQTSLGSMCSALPATIREPEIRPHCPDDRKGIVVKAMEDYYKEHYDINTMDGVRVEFGNGAWTGIRQSNTSPKLSISFEAKTVEDINSMKAVLAQQLKNFPEVEVEL